MLRVLFKQIKTKKEKRKEMQKKLEILELLIDDLNKRIKSCDDLTTKSYLIIMQLGFLDEKDELINKIKT